MSKKVVIIAALILVMGYWLTHTSGPSIATRTEAPAISYESTTQEPKPSTLSAQSPINAETQKDTINNSDKISKNEGLQLGNYDYCWFYEIPTKRTKPAFEQGYDTESLDFVSQRDPHDPWGENSFHAIEVEKVFGVTLFSLENPKQKIQFKLKLFRKEGSPGLNPSWIELKSKSHYLKFNSEFEKNEIYPGTLHFPYDSTWRQIIPNRDCKEISVIHEGTVFEGETRFIDYFDARVFCRNGLKELLGVAQLRAKITNEISQD